MYISNEYYHLLPVHSQRLCDSSYEIISLIKIIFTSLKNVLNSILIRWYLSLYFLIARTARIECAETYRQTHCDTYIQDNYWNPCCACVPRVNKPRVVFTDFRVHYFGLTKWCRWF